MSSVFEHARCLVKKFPNDSFKKLTKNTVVDDIELKCCRNYLLLYFRTIWTRLSRYLSL